LKVERERELDLITLCTPLERDLLAIAKFLVSCDRSVATRPPESAKGEWQNSSMLTWRKSSWSGNDVTAVCPHQSTDCVQWW